MGDIWLNYFKTANSYIGWGRFHPFLPRDNARDYNPYLCTFFVYKHSDLFVLYLINKRNNNNIMLLCSIKTILTNVWLLWYANNSINLNIANLYNHPSSTIK